MSRAQSGKASAVCRAGNDRAVSPQGTESLALTVKLAASPWPSSFFSWNSLRQTLGLARSSRKPWHRGKESSSVRRCPLNTENPKLRRGQGSGGHRTWGTSLHVTLANQPQRTISPPCWSTPPGLCPWLPPCLEVPPHFIPLELCLPSQAACSLGAVPSLPTSARQ